MRKWMNSTACLFFAVLILAFRSEAEVFGGSPDPIVLHPGFLTRIQCEGRLLISAVGSDELVRLEALPKELGCGVILKPKAQAGRTNLILETSTGSLDRMIEIQPITSGSNGKSRGGER